MFLRRYQQPRFDVIEAVKAVVIWTCGVIEFAILALIIFGGIYFYAMSKGVP